jgi:hypothetical protein
VQASATGPDQAKVTWAAGSGGGDATSYRITRSDRTTITSTTRTATSAGLAPGRAYTFTVVATNTAGPSPSSAPSNEVTVPAVPQGEVTVDSVTAKRVVSGANLAIVVSWATTTPPGWEITKVDVVGTSEHGVPLFAGTATQSPVTDPDEYNACWPDATYSVTVHSRPTTQAGAPKTAKKSATVTGAPPCTADVELDSAVAGADGTITGQARCLTAGHGEPRYTTIGLEVNGDLRGAARCDSGQNEGGGIYSHTFTASGLSPDTQYRVNAVTASVSEEKRTSPISVTTEP